MATAPDRHESMIDSQHKWDAVYSKADTPTTAAEVLARHQHLLPESGRALDLACGLGGNALFLANCGLQVDAWDISAAGLPSIKAFISLPANVISVPKR